MPITIDKKAGKKDGLSRYRVRVNYTDSNGKAKQIERKVWGREEARRVEMTLETEYKEKEQAPSARMTVDELFQRYNAYHATETRRTSHEATMKRLERWVLPYFANKRLDKLNQQDFADWKIKISGENFSVVYKQNLYCAFVAMLNYAVKMEYIPKNNLSILGNFRDSSIIETTKSKELHYYTAEQFEQYISVAKKECKTLLDWGFYVFFCIAFFTGARKGEINALKWSDIEGNIMHIRRSIAQKLKGGDAETAPKNRSSIRNLQLPTPLINVLNEQKERQKKWAGKHFNEDFRVCGGVGTLRDTTIDKRNRHYADKAGLPRIRIHDFRHSHVSLLANEGINIQEVARRLGHSNVQETWNRYSHLYPREEERAVSVLNNISAG